jgi:hypothetical protein
MRSTKPNSVGVPLRTPVVEFKDNHGGSVLVLNIALLLADIV